MEKILKISRSKKQKHKKWELIFVDNNSKDKTKNIYKKHKDKRFKYFNTNKNLKLGVKDNLR